VQYQKISILPHRRDWNFLGLRGGGSIRTKQFKEMYETYWKVIVPSWCDSFRVQPSAHAGPFPPLSDLK